MAVCNNTTYNAMVMNSTELRLAFSRYSFFVNMLEYNIPNTMIINKVATPLLILIGTVGNIISVLVWANPRMRTSNTAAYYLTCLAIADLTYLIIHIFSELEQPWLLGALDLQGWCQIFSVANISIQYFVVFLVFAFTVERFLSICFPFKSERFGKTRTPRTIASLLVLCISLGIPQAYFWHINHVGECQVRRSVNIMTSVSFYSVFTWTTELAIFGVLPICVLILNSAVLMKLRTVGKLNLGKVKFKTQRQGDEMLHKSKEQMSRMTDQLMKSNTGRKDREQLMNGTSSSPVSVRSTNGASSYGGAAQANHMGTTITLLGVSFFLIATMLPNTIVYALQHSVKYGGMPCKIEDMGGDPVWTNYFDFMVIKLIIKEISLCHHVGNVFIYMATSSRFVRVVFKSLVRRTKPCTTESSVTTLRTIRSNHFKSDGDAL